MCSILNSTLAIKISNYKTVHKCRGVLVVIKLQLYIIAIHKACRMPELGGPALITPHHKA